MNDEMMKATDEADESETDEADGDCTANQVSFVDFNSKDVSA